LLEASRSLFVQRGVEQVSIDAITRSAGVAKGSFYNHFESRDALYEELLESTLQALLEKYQTFNPSIDDPLELALARTWFGFYTLLSDPQACHLLLQAGPAAPGGAVDRVLRMVVSDEVKEGVALGSLHHLDPELVYASYFGVVTEAIGHLLIRGSELDPVLGADQVTELSFAALGLPHHTPSHHLDGHLSS
jgi:AcrR family transcriptional regulator